MYSFDDIDDSYIDELHSQWEDQIPWGSDDKRVIISTHALKRLQERFGIKPTKRNINKIKNTVLSDKDRVVEVSSYESAGLRTTFRDDSTGKNVILVYKFDKSSKCFVVKTIFEDISKRDKILTRIVKQKRTNIF